MVQGSGFKVQRFLLTAIADFFDRDPTYQARSNERNGFLRTVKKNSL
ncbi:hypothetical protein D1AOALGA4SA_3936 [Olavius algarvensis Delta 1 endosymbiont]|nr:hypothetical protein D1AOALGA4SA_3936 [Olavius algarvensis Delta 1 endosymbiont]